MNELGNKSNRARSTRAVLGVLLTVAISSALFVASPATARDLPKTGAERVGMSTERLSKLKSLSEAYVADKKVPGMVTMIARRGKIVQFEASGTRGADDPRPLTRDALFRIYSMTKPIASVALMMLYEEGHFQLNDPAHKFIPELKSLTVFNPDGEPTPAKREITMKHLLTHTAGLSYGFNPADPVDQQYIAAKIWESKDLDEFARTVAALPLQFEPGERWHYSVATDFVGLAVQRISGQPLDAFLAERIFQPLGMQDTFFNVPPAKRERFLPNHGWDPEANRLVDVTARTDARRGYTDGTLFSGGGGLVSSTMDYMRFAEMLRNGGSYNGQRLLSPKTIEFMTMNHLPSTLAAAGSGEAPQLGALGGRGVGFGLGFAVVTDVAGTAIVSSPGEFSWGGAAGTVFWIDPVEQIVAIGMIQLMRSPWPLRADLKTRTYQALTQLSSSR